jgi:hypothetical protein
MTMWFYVKTSDAPKIVGEIVCAYNVLEDPHPRGKFTWQVEAVNEEPESWQIMSRFEDSEDSDFVALIYRAGDAVVLGEVDDDFVPNFLDPLLEKYGLDNVRWIVSAARR